MVWGRELLSWSGSCGGESPRTLAPGALSRHEAPSRGLWTARPSLSPSPSPELPYEDVFAVWEVIWAARHISSEHFVLFIALALVEAYREIIRDNNMDFTDIIKFFNGRSHSAIPAASAGPWGPPLLAGTGFGGPSGILPLPREQMWQRSRVGSPRAPPRPPPPLSYPCSPQSELSITTPRRSCGSPGTSSTRCRCS